MPKGFYIGPLFIYFYAILIMLGALAATWLASRRAKRAGNDPEFAWDMLPWLLIGGIIGARIWHILTPPASMVEQGLTTMWYLTHPLDAINIRKGGLGIPGAVMGGVFALWLYCRKRKASFTDWLDYVAPGLALAQAVGRWGNFFNQELYGAPSTLPWAITIDPQNRLAGFQDVATYHPLFLYECLWNLLNMGLLLWLGNRWKERLKSGDLFLVYMIMYAVGRFSLEYLRLDPSPVAGLNVNQTVMGIIFVLSVAGLIYKHRKEISFLNRKEISE
jgi:phosphatidylglycerol---prolipoprotein diacylglyceryl transferase